MGWVDDPVCLKMGDNMAIGYSVQMNNMNGILLHMDSFQTMLWMCTVRSVIAYLMCEVLTSSNTIWRLCILIKQHT